MMEKLIKPSDKEFMRMAMLKHEQIFREQVYELHRLYRIQKILMKNTANRNDHHYHHHHHKVAQEKKPEIKFDLERPAEEHIGELDGDDEVREMIDESEIELTLGPSSYYNRRNKKVDTPLTSDSGNSLSSSSTGSSHINKTTREEDLSGLRNSFDIEEERLRQQQEKLEQPPWLFQVLSMSMT